MVNNLNAKNASTATNSSTTNNHRNNHNHTHYLTEVELIDPKLIVHRPKVRSLWYHCILYCLNQLKNGTSILLSDVDNISYRHIPLSDFQAGPYDAIYSLSERKPQCDGMRSRLLISWTAQSNHLPTLVNQLSGHSHGRIV